MANLERTMSCPPQLSVERTEDKGEASESPPEAGTDISLASSTNLSPVKSSADMVRGVDMSELVRKLSSQRQANTDSSENGHEEEDEENEEEEGGAHDTITSLAGAHMLQKFSRIGSSRDRKFRAYKNSDLKGSITHLENLFKEDPLLEEDEKVEDHLENDTFNDTEEDVFVPPDGGYGWFISLGAFIALFWTAGMVKSYGVLFSEMITIYPDSISLAAWIPAVMTTTALAMAPIASGLCQRFNCRYVTALGSILAFTGVTLSSVMPNLQSLFVSLGMLTGMGIGLATTPGIILTARYFDKRRSLANALCLSGTAAGSFTLPVLISFLLDKYGFHGTLLVLGACLLNVCISAALYRPLATHIVILRRKEKLQTTKEAPKDLDTLENTLTDGEKIENVARPPTRIDPIKTEKIEGACSYGDNKFETCSVDMPNYSSSLPNNTIIDTHSINERFINEDCHLANKRNSIHSSFDSISMMSSVSQDYLEHGEAFTPNLWSGRTSPSMSNKHVSRAGTNIESGTNAKSLSLRELALHQIGSHLSLYKSMFLGSGSNIKKPVPCPEESCHCHKKTVKPRRSSYMFSIEDIMVDSTSVLKDARHPSHTHLNGGETHRVVNLNRTQSAVGEIKSRKKSSRQRFYSENTFNMGGITRNSSFCQKSVDGLRMELIGSSELFATPITSPRMIDKRGKFTLEPVKSTEEDKSSSPKKRDNFLEEKGHYIVKAVEKYINIHLVKDPVFILLTGSVMFMAIGVPHSLFFLPSHAKFIGLPSNDASFLLSISAIFDLAGRLSLGFILDLNLFPKYICYSLMMFISGISAILLPSTQTFTQVAMCMGFYGLGSGGWFLMVPLLLAENLGVENIASSYGLVRLFQSITNFCGPIIAGLLMDGTGKPSASFYFMGVHMALGSLIILMLPAAMKRKKKNAENIPQ